MNAARDDNNVPTALGVLDSDGSTVVKVQVNPANFALKVDDWPYGLIPNPDFADQPPFTAATNVTNRWIDGTAGGSLTDDTYGWATTSTSGGNLAASYDTVDSRTCMKMAATNITRSGGGTSISQAIVSTFPEYTGGTITVSNLEDYAIPVTAGQIYTFSSKYYIEAVSNTSRIVIQMTYTFYTSGGVRLNTLGENANLTILNAWTTLTESITAPATSAYVVFTVRVTAGGAVDFSGESATVNWTDLTITSSAIKNPQRALRDDNFVPTLLAVSSVDGETPVVLYTDSEGKLLIDSN